MVWSFLGLSAQQQADREIGDLNNINTGFRDWDAGDRFRAWLTGVDKEDLLKRTQQLAVDEINRNNAKLIGQTNTALSGTPLKQAGGSTKYKPGQTEAEFVSDLTTDQTRGTLALTVLNDEDFSGTIDPNAGVGDLTRLAGDTKKARRNRKRDENIADRKDERDYQTGLLNHQFKTSEARRAHEAQQAQLDRQLNRDLENNRSDMQMQIAQMNADLADKRLAYDRETKRMDRRDRAIAQLMSGLGQLGGAFSL